MRTRSLLVAAVALLACAGCSPYTLWRGKTPDRQHDVEVRESSGRQYVRVDGKQGPLFKSVAPRSLTMSADGKHIAYAAQYNRYWYVIRDEVDDSPSWDAVGEIAFSPRGKRLAYAAEARQRWYVMVDGYVVGHHGAILAGTLRFSDDEEHVIYAATEGNTARVVVDGRMGPPLDRVGRILVSPDAAHIVHVASVEGFAHVVVDGVLGERWQAIDDLLLGRNGRLAFIGRGLDGKTRVVSRRLDGNVGVEESEPMEAAAGLASSSDDEHLAWVAHADGRHTVVVDGKELPPLPAYPVLAPVPSSLAFRPGTSEVAFVARDPKGRRIAVVGSNVSARFDDIDGPRILFSEGGNRAGFTGRRGGTSIVVLDGVEQSPEAWASRPVFSPDGARAAYLARRGDRMAVVVDGESHVLDLAVDDTLAFSRDGKHWACIGGAANERALYFFVDGRRRGDLDFVEIVSVAARYSMSDVRLGRADDVLRSWAQAEAERAP